ncbi:unnamed protein product [Jaminaea pallidilutea]
MKACIASLGKKFEQVIARSLAGELDQDGFSAYDVTIFNEEINANETIPVEFHKYTTEASARHDLAPDDREGYPQEVLLGKRQALTCASFRRCARQLFDTGVDLQRAAVATTASTVNAADAALRAYLTKNDYANANSIIQGTLISFVTGPINSVSGYYINEGLKGKKGQSNQCGAERPVDLVESAVKKLRASCEAIQAQNSAFEAGTAFKVNRGPRDLDGSVTFGQEICAKVVVSANRASFGEACKIAGVTI